MLYGRPGAFSNGSARENWFVFVIRQGSVFKCKEPPGVQTKRFKFFTLELPLPPREHRFPSLAGVSVGDVDFAEVDRKLFDGAVEMGSGRSASAATLCSFWMGIRSSSLRFIRVPKIVIVIG
jgi:hypothetical protein